MRSIWMALSVGLLAIASPAVADQAALDNLMQDKFQIAEDFEVAGFASENCPGLHFLEDAMVATEVDLGFTEDDDVIYSPEYNFWAKRGRMNAKIGYDKDPAAWCESMWKFLGPEHPPMIRRALLEKK
jgi:hypothetical protein